jgi:hypothetical protein
MNGKIYIFKSPLINGEIIFKYNILGFLKKIIYPDNFKKHQYIFIAKNFPFYEKLIEKWKEKKGNFSIKEIPIDLSFNRFWNDYNYKIGKKKMAENIWKKMSYNEKIKALSYIPKYINHIKNKNYDQAYPTTYLNQRYFDI